MKKHAPIPIRLVFSTALFLISATQLSAWGPHPEIVDAAIAVLPSEDQARLARMLGDEARRLRFLVWMGDFANQYVSLNEAWWGEKPESPAVQFYANDYLIFPAAPRQYQHDIPDVTNTFAPFFVRALQALQTETPANAARWIGSLLHFTTDTGSPPHAASISGDMHTKMENWIDGSAISISGYQPRLFGKKPNAAIQGFKARMDGLIAFSKQRAERLRPFIIATNRPAAEPIVMESANETARVTADLLHTLLFLAEQTPEAPGGSKGFGELEATISGPTLQGLESMPAKLMIAGTAYSTLSELVSCEKGLYRAAFFLRNIRPGSYKTIVSRVGDSSLFLSLNIAPGKRAHFDWKLDAAVPEGNLVRNPGFQIRWASADPENWRFDKAAGAWVCDNIKVRGGAKYRVEAVLQDNAKVQVRLRWYTNHWQAASEPISVPAADGRMSLEAVSPANAEYLRLFVSTKDDPARVLRSIALIRL